MDTTITELFITLEILDAHDNILLSKQIPKTLLLKCLTLWGFDPQSTGNDRIRIKAPNGSIIKTF
jgi:hypothetical protein